MSKTTLDAKKHSLLFYNVENLYDIHDDPQVADWEFTPQGEKRWTRDKYLRKQQVLAKVIASVHSHHPVVFGLTEVENWGVVEDLIRQDFLRGYSYEIIHQDSGDSRGIDLCLVYDKDYVHPLEHSFLRIHFPWNRDIKTRDVLFFKGLINDEILWIVVNHWPSRRDGEVATEKKRIHVAKQVRKKLEQIISEDPWAKILVMGDFNDEPHNASLEKVLKAKRTKNIREDEFYNLMSHLDKKDLGTSSHLGKWLTIDQILINRNLLQNNNKGIGIRDNKGYIFQEKKVLFCRPNGDCQPNQSFVGNRFVGGASDHLPVFVVLD